LALVDPPIILEPLWADTWAPSRAGVVVLPKKARVAATATTTTSAASSVQLHLLVIRFVRYPAVDPRTTEVAAIRPGFLRFTLASDHHERANI
jgi:hypothetical protein